MKSKEIRAIYYVKNINSTRKFYEGILGFKVSYEWNRSESDQGVIYDTGYGYLEFMTKTDAPSFGANTRLALGVEDVWSLYEDLRAKVTIAHDLINNWWGETSFGIKDPNGLEVVFLTETTGKANQES